MPIKPKNLKDKILSDFRQNYIFNCKGCKYFTYIGNPGKTVLNNLNKLYLTITLKIGNCLNRLIKNN